MPRRIGRGNPLWLPRRIGRGNPLWLPRRTGRGNPLWLPRWLPGGAGRGTPLWLPPRIGTGACIRAGTGACPYGGHTEQHNDPVHMVRHHLKCINGHTRIGIRQLIPNHLHHPAGIVQPDLAVSDVPEHTAPILRADGNEIRPGRRVVVPLQTDGTAMMLLRLVGRHRPFPMIGAACSVRISPKIGLDISAPAWRAWGVGASVPRRNVGPRCSHGRQGALSPCTRSQ